MVERPSNDWLRLAMQENRDLSLRQFSGSAGTLDATEVRPSGAQLDFLKI